MTELDDDDDPVPLEQTRPEVTGVHAAVVGWDIPTGEPVQQVQLVCVAGPDLGRTFPLTAMEALIGRGAVDVSLHGNDVSRQHAKIRRQADQFTLEDLGSANGTFVNGTRVGKEPAQLRIGDRVQVGATIMTFAHFDELEERMRQLQRLEAMGTMAGGLAHDFNNALTVILGNMEALRPYLPKDGEAQEIVDEMKDAATSASQLAQRLLRLGRSEPGTYGVVRLASLVDRATATMRRQPGPKVAVSSHVPSELAAGGSFEELHQVLVNLYLNARDAMPDGGVFRIQARGLKLDAAAALAKQLGASGDYVELSASDTGCGMDAQTIARIFEPFFTTKPPGKGTGLGLAMVHGIVRRHGGAIDVESVPRAGTTIRILLPAGRA